MTFRRTTAAVGILVLLIAASCSSAFQSPVNGRTTTTTTRQTTTLNMAVVVDPNIMHDYYSIITQSSSSHDHLLLNTPQLLWMADAATAAKSDNGWWSAYLNIFKTALSAVHSTIDGPLRSVGIETTWGPSIALFTAGVRSLLIPLSVQQSKSAEYMKALKPYLAEIKEKFADNPDAQNRAMGKLYEDANQNPLSGCLLSIVQIPIFLGLYRGVRLLAMDGIIDEPFLWIPSLQGPVTAASDYRGMDWLTQNWVQDASSITGGYAPPLGWETTLAFLVMPVLLVLGQSLTMQALQPPMDDENQSEEEREQMEKTQGILKFLPLMIGFFSLQVPAGLTIYWFTSNLFSLTQSLAVRKYYEANPPQIELPEYWDSLDKMEELSLEDKKKAAAAGIAVGPKLEDLMANAKFHPVIERGPLRAESEAWTRVESAEKLDIPAELQAWVGDATTSKQQKESPTPQAQSA